MARKQDSEPLNPVVARPGFDGIVALTDAFRREHLKAEYEAGWGISVSNWPGPLAWRTSPFPWERFDAVHPD